MIILNQIKMKPGYSMKDLESRIRKILHLKSDEVISFELRRQSIDARKKPDIFYVCSVAVSFADSSREVRIAEKCHDRNVVFHEDDPYAYADISVQNVKQMRQIGKMLDPPVIIGAGPAGLFCALLLARAGLCPIVIERGERASVRKMHVQKFWETGVLDPESNVQFGEGGAGTFSDGKLNTGVRDPEGRIRFILRTFIEHGADPDILYDAHPHVGTDVLLRVIPAITQEIRDLGGVFYFNTCFQSLEKREDGYQISCVNRKREKPGITAHGSPKRSDSFLNTDPPTFENTETVSGSESERELTFYTQNVVLAIGHSARDTFSYLYRSGFVMRQKAFAVGLRIMHPQDMIDRALYGSDPSASLPPAPYKLTHRLPNNRGVYSFCMCPGGYVVNASSEPGMTAVNGMSDRRRDSGMANSAIAVTVSPEEIRQYMNVSGQTEDALLGVAFQRKLEQAAFRMGNGKIPVQRFLDYQRGRGSEACGRFSPVCKGDWMFGNVRSLLPETIASGIEQGILSWDRQIRGFADPDTLLAGVESRTSSPVRIERSQTLSAIGFDGIYPCGEGAGYAGGIVSAAIDGLRIAEAVIEKDR